MKCCTHVLQSCSCSQTCTSAGFLHQLLPLHLWTWMQEGCPALPRLCRDSYEAVCPCVFWHGGALCSQQNALLVSLPTAATVPALWPWDGGLACSAVPKGSEAGSGGSRTSPMGTWRPSGAAPGKLEAPGEKQEGSKAGQLFHPTRSGCSPFPAHHGPAGLWPHVQPPEQTAMVSHSLLISAWARCPCSYSTADSDFRIVHCLLMTYYKVELVLFMSSHEEMGFHPLGDDSFIGLDSLAPNT